MLETNNGLTVSRHQVLLTIQLFCIKYFTMNKFNTQVYLHHTNCSDIDKDIVIKDTLFTIDGKSKQLIFCYAITCAFIESPFPKCAVCTCGSFQMPDTHLIIPFYRFGYLGCCAGRTACQEEKWHAEAIRGEWAFLMNCICA